MSDLWTEATYDAESEMLAQRVTAAKVAASDLMPFLLAAENEVDFRNRKAMVADRLDVAVAGVTDTASFALVRSTVEGHLDEDFQTLAAAREHEAVEQQRLAAEAKATEEAFLARVQATLAAKQAEAEMTCATCGDKIAKDPSGEEPSTYHHDNGEKHDHEATPASAKESAKQAARDTGNCAECGRAISYDSSTGSWSHDNEGPDTQHPAKKASLQTQAEFPPKKDEQPAATGTETENKPEEQSSGTVERKVELDPASGQWVGSEWEEAEDGATLVQSASTYGNNPRFASEEEANGWVAEGGKTEDTTKPDEEPVEQPKSDDPFPEKEGKQSTPFGREAALSCGKCGSSDVILTIAPGASGSGPGGGWRMGDSGGEDVVQCRSCGAQTPAFPKQAAAGDVCPTCHGSGQVAAPEGSTNEGYEACPDCSGTGKTASVKMAGPGPMVYLYRNGPTGETRGFVDNALVDGVVYAEAPNVPGAWVRVPDGIDGEHGTTFDPQYWTETGRVTVEEFMAGRTAGLQTEAEKVVPAGTEVTLPGGQEWVSLGQPASTWSGYDYGEGTLFQSKSDPNVQRAILHKEMNDMAPGHGLLDVEPQGTTASKTAAEDDIAARMYDWGYEKGKADLAAGTVQEKWNGDQPGMTEVDMRTSDAAFPRGYRDAVEGKPKQASLQRAASWVEKARSVVTQHQHVDVGGGVLLDATTANMLITVYDSLSPENKAKFEAMDLLKAVDIGWKLVTPKGAAKTAGVPESEMGPNEMRCDACDGSGVAWDMTCQKCGGYGVIDKSQSRKKSSAGGDAAPFVGEAPEDLTSEAFTRRNDGYPQDPVPSGSSNPYVPSAGSVTSEPIKAEDKPWYYGLGETNPERRQKARSDMPSERKPKDTSATASIEEVTARLIAEADSNPYSTQGNPYIPPQVPPGTSDDVLDGPVNPAPQMLEVPMTTRPRQMPSGDSTLPAVEDPAEPDQSKEIS